MTNNSSQIDPKVFMPDHSVFVAANAGSGKTTLLTNRVLSLLVHGARPGSILCLTFTNAAAAEMSSRVQARLGAWVMMEEGALADEIAQLTGTQPDRTTLARARSLFAHVLEAPDGGVRMQTIHGFCQSLLRRFPVEAGVNPHFTLMDARSEEALLREARMRLLAHIGKHDDEIRQAVQALAADSGEYNLQDLLTYIVAGKRRFAQLVTDKKDLMRTVGQIWQSVALLPDDSFEHLLARHLPYDEATHKNLREVTVALDCSGSNQDQKSGQLLADWLVCEDKTPDAAQRYFDVFYTGTGTVRKKLHTKDALNETQVEALTQEAARVAAFRDAWHSLILAQRSSHTLLIAYSLLSIYAALKDASAWLDFDDLIARATQLLAQPDISPWILYKLDGGIDHVLVDEAQDTSPQQWAIIKAITEDFFAGQSRIESDRSLFIVGDEKQSIYRFQGADVAALRIMQDYFLDKISQSGARAKRVEMIRSYRSLPDILQAVDAVFADEHLKQCIMPGQGALAHTAWRQGSAGLVELWPLHIKEKQQTRKPQARQIEQIADRIATWLQDGLQLASKNRAVQPGDIMVLVRTRTTFVQHLQRALKRRGIPVAGVDRMMLGDNLAVQDLLALGQFVLLPEDDLTLACVLKSPICNISEDTLFTLAYGRGELSLWQRLADMAAQDEACKKAYELLALLRSRADYLSVYALYALLLDTQGVRANFLGRMGEEYADPIDEFLLQAKAYDLSHTPSLQGFIIWLSRSQAEIKRDMEQAHGAVRIMTVHAAKGLQAPIVILPDTTGLPKTDSTALWLREENLPLWPRAKAQYNQLCEDLYAQEKADDLAEYYRQLYVAMTRAEDQLYICGAVSSSKASDDSWYAQIHNGLKKVAIPFDSAVGTGLRLGEVPAFGGAKDAGIATLSSEADLSYLNKDAPQEPLPSRPLAPSRVVDDAPASSSPLEARRHYSRGKLIHQLLQYLPEVQADERFNAAARIASGFSASLNEAQQQQAVDEALAVMDNPQFGFLFAEGSNAEVPITGTVALQDKPHTLTGQIDRLYVGDEIWVVDYKTSRQPPSDIADVPPAYVRQLALYRLLLTTIYPEKTAHCALLWTFNAQFMQIPAMHLDGALA